MLLLGIGLLAWGLWPARHSTQTLFVQLHDQAGSATPSGTAGSDSGAQVPSGYTLVLDYPRVIRVGDSQLVRLRISSSLNYLEGDLLDRPVSATDESLPADGGSHETFAVQARLELDDASVRPAGDITVPWTADHGANFTWTIKGTPGSNAGGTAWSFLLPIGSADLVQERHALAAQPLQVRQTTLFGLNGPASRVTGAVLVLVAAALEMPWLDRGLRDLAKRRRPPAA